ncbi:MAG: hypothetical protein JWN12_273 [Candidatus Saccharibacteria bacterium]|nr:hypothetical protein [Candidatus Saccharibacteria bacterium]
MSPIRGRRIMANMSAFQANDESSILSARTKIIDKASGHTNDGTFCYNNDMPR